MDISGIVKELIYKEPFYGHVALGINKSFSTRIPTAAAVVRRGEITPELLFNAEYVDKLSQKQQIGVMQHELMHICLGHMTEYWDLPNKYLANVAMDMMINQYIGQEFRPPKCILPECYPELKIPPFKDTRFYYDLLDKNKDQSQDLLNQLAAMALGDLTHGHIWWDEMDPSMQEVIKKQCEGHLKFVYEDVLNKNAGSIPGYLRGIIDKLYEKVPPVLDWKKAVRQFRTLSTLVYLRKSKRKLNMRYPDNAASKLKCKTHILVVFDTSGSIRDHDISNFIDQVDYIHKTGTTVDIMECDAKIGRVYRYKNRQESLRNITGGGGTHFNPVFQYLKDHPRYSGAIFCTDGYPGDKQEISISQRVLWVITTNGTTDFPFDGTKVQMKGT